MTKWKWSIPLSCLVVFHSPDGKELLFDSRHIAAVRPVEGAIRQHLHPNTNAVIYASTQTFGVIETVEEVEQQLKECPDQEDPDATH
jgi:hypothetical protein